MTMDVYIDPEDRSEDEDVMTPADIVWIALIILSVTALGCLAYSLIYGG